MSGAPTTIGAILLAVSIGVLTACAPASQRSNASAASTRAEPASQPPVAAPLAAAATVDVSLPPMLVHKSPTCGCCASWVEHMRKAGFAVEVRDTDNLDPVKTRLGVPVGKGSCHTAEVGGYFVEGHVPASDIKRLLADKPAAKGLVLPGMPMGSPGMEAPDGSVTPFTVELVALDASTTAFAQHGP